MKKVLYMAAIIIGSVLTTVDAKETEVRLRELRFKINDSESDPGGLILTTTFDIKKAPLFDEAVFFYYLLLTPRDDDRKPQFFRCRIVYRYLKEKTGYRAYIGLPREMKECINPSDEKYAVVVFHKGVEVDLKSSESDRWWEDPALGEPIENVFYRYSDVPYIKEWESIKEK